MPAPQFIRSRLAPVLALLALLGGCAQWQPPAESETAAAEPSPYLIGPGDNLQVFVWRNPDLSVSVPVRPDGRISTPLIEDMVAEGKTPTALARDIENALKEYVQEPVTTVIVTSFVGPLSRQVRVVGEATKPTSLPYRQNLSVLDVMIAVGGTTPFAAGNRATLSRRTPEGRTRQIPVNLDALLKDGDMRANVTLQPGDVLVIPQSWF